MDIQYLRTAVIDHPTRPIIHHLNADTSWLLQLPNPKDGTSRKYYNILIDPWLSGSQSDLASWFSQQWHATPSAYGSIKEVQDLCATVESLSNGGGDGMNKLDSAGKNYLDALAISHEFTDHCHKPTLLEIPKETPVYAWSKAVKLIKGFKHFDNVIEIPAFNKDWRVTSMDPLPEWLGIGRLFNESDGLYYHAALTISFQLPSSPTPECIIYTPHGLHAPTLTPIPLSDPPVRPLCLLHGLHDVYLDWRQQLNLGAHHALAAQRMLGAKYWMGTHDEDKKGTGVVSWFLRRKVLSVKEAVEREMQQAEGEAEKAGAVSEVEWEEKAKRWEETGWREIGNGEAVILREDGQ